MQEFSAQQVEELIAYLTEQAEKLRKTMKYFEENPEEWKKVRNFFVQIQSDELFDHLCQGELRAASGAFLFSLDPVHH